MGRERKGEGYAGNKTCIFLEIMQSRQARSKEREGLSYAILDGNTEGANLQPTNLCLHKSKTYTAWAIPSVTL